MKNTFGNALTVTLFGESHGPAIGAVLDGLAPGIPVHHEWIRRRLDRRRPKDRMSTARQEPDAYEILSGEKNGYTTGTPLTLVIRNQNQRSDDYEHLKNTPRPAHADYTAQIKYHGFQDPAGGGHFSGRITAALVAAGAIVEGGLAALGIRIGTQILQLGGTKDTPIASSEDVELLEHRDFPTLSTEAERAMRAHILKAAEEGDSVGGVLGTTILGVPAGVGEPWFDTVEGMLSHGIFSIPGVKGVSFGDGFSLCDLRGSEANDPFTVRNGRVITLTNRAGGINGGITNGMPICIQTAVKPTPSIFKEQRTVQLSTMEDTTLTIHGRHDPAIIHRAAPVVSAMCALVVADLLTVRYGTDILAKGEFPK